MVLQSLVPLLGRRRDESPETAPQDSEILAVGYSNWWTEFLGFNSKRNHSRAKDHPWGNKYSSCFVCNLMRENRRAKETIRKPVVHNEPVIHRGKDARQCRFANSKKTRIIRSMQL